MSKASRLDYAYAIGRVRALERFLVPRAVFQEAVETSDHSAALKLISDAGRYPEGLTRVRDSAELDDILAGEGEALKREMTDLLLEKDVLAFFLLSDDLERALPLAARSGYPFLQDYIRHRIDLGNIKMVCRAKYLKWPAEHLKIRLLRGGLIEPKKFLDTYNLSLAEIGERCATSLYHHVMTRGTDTLTERETFVVLERGIEDFLMAYLRRARAYIFGPEQVFAYAEAKRRELALVRLLGVGKMALIPAEVLKERISETYV